MCFSTNDNAPIEFAQEQLAEKGPDGQRILQMGMTVWNSTPAKEAQMVSGRWEGNRTYSHHGMNSCR